DEQEDEDDEEEEDFAYLGEEEGLPWEVEHDIGVQRGSKKVRVTERTLIDQVDPFLESRASLYSVALVGTNVHAAWPKSHDWPGYTRRALSEGAVLAVMRTMYDPAVSAAKVKSAWQRL